MPQNGPSVSLLWHLSSSAVWLSSSLCWAQTTPHRWITTQFPCERTSILQRPKMQVLIRLSLIWISFIFILCEKLIIFFLSFLKLELASENDISWHGDSSLSDDIWGGYYNGGDNIKYHFPTSFAMTMLCFGIDLMIARTPKRINAEIWG